MENPYAHDVVNAGGSAREPRGVNIDAQIRVMQIIAGALIMGTVFFLIIAVLATQGRLDGNPDVLTLIAAGFGMLMTANHFVIPPIMSGTQFRVAVSNGLMSEDDAGRVKKCVELYQTGMIVGMALLEGAAFFNLIVLMVEHHPLPLAVAGGLLLLMIIRFPTRKRVVHWTEDKLRALEGQSLGRQ